MAALVSLDGHGDQGKVASKIGNGSSSISEMLVDTATIGCSVFLDLDLRKL